MGKEKNEEFHHIHDLVRACFNICYMGSNILRYCRSQYEESRRTRGDGVIMNNNHTLDVILDRLPKKPLLTTREISDACNLATTKPILDAVKDGRLHAVIFGKHVIISRENAIEFLKKKAY